MHVPASGSAITTKDLLDAQPEAGLRAEQLTIESFAALYRRLAG